MSLDFQFRELGNTGWLTTNLARQTAAGTTALAAATVNTAYTVYQIDWDLAVAGQNMIVGDNVAGAGDRIILDQKGVTQGTRVYPQGIQLRMGQALAVQLLAGGGGFGTDAWIRVTYTADNLKRS
jgi:hypothetical protein